MDATQQRRAADRARAFVGVHESREQSGSRAEAEMPQFKQAVGPLWSNSGLRAWNLLLAHDEIVAQRYRTWDMWKLAFAARTGLVADPGQEWRSHPESVSLQEAGGFRYYTVNDLESILVTVSYGQNSVSLRLKSGRSDRYDIQHRPLTQPIMKVLQTMYPTLYTESGVPTTLLGRLSKS